jgi:hypothetical protein
MAALHPVSQRILRKSRQERDLHKSLVKSGVSQQSHNSICASGFASMYLCVVPLEDSEDYAAFEMAVTADYDTQSAVERELVLRLASLLWRLRRATAIESGLFKIQAKQLLQFRQRRQAHQKRQEIIGSMYQDAVAAEDSTQKAAEDTGSQPILALTDQSDDLTRSFVRLTNLPTYPLDRLSRIAADSAMNVAHNFFMTPLS